MRSSLSRLHIVLGVLLLVSAMVAAADLAAVSAFAHGGNALTIEGVWARAAGRGHNSAVYMDIANNGANDIAFISASADVADRVEIHETTMELTVVDGKVSQIMRMGQIERLVVPAGGTAALRPGGLHVMLLGLTRELEEGDSFSLTLYTEDGDSVVLDVPVTVGLGVDDDHDHHHHHHDHDHHHDGHGHDHGEHHDHHDH